MKSDNIVTDKTFFNRKMGIFFLSLLENFCCGVHWKHLNETLPTSTHNKYFFEKYGNKRFEYPPLLSTIGMNERKESGLTAQLSVTMSRF